MMRVTLDVEPEQLVSVLDKNLDLHIVDQKIDRDLPVLLYFSGVNDSGTKPDAAFPDEYDAISYANHRRYPNALIVNLLTGEEKVVG